MAAAGSYDAKEIGAALAPYAVADPSERVEAAATSALGKVHSFDVQTILVQNVIKESYQHQIRIAAIRALTDRDDPQAIPVAMRYALYGRHDRVRPVAIRALGKLARAHPQDRAKIRSAIIRWLTDPQDRTVLASVEALADIGDAESSAALRKLLDSSPRPMFYYPVKDALARIKPESESEAVKSLHQSVEELRDQLSKMREQLNTVKGSSEKVDP